MLKQKLTSRKFWAAIIGFATPVMVLLGVDEVTREQIIALIAAAAPLVAYIVGEGLVDAARARKDE